MTDDELRQACIKFLEELLPTLYKSDMTSHNLVLRFAKQQQAVGVRMAKEEMSHRYNRTWDCSIFVEEYIDWCEAKSRELEI